MLSQEQNTQFSIYCKKYIPEYMLRGSDDIFFMYNEEWDMYRFLYQYDNEDVNFVFGRLHYYINTWFEVNAQRVELKNNRYLTSDSRSKIHAIKIILEQLKQFFKSCGFAMEVATQYKNKIYEVVNFISADNSEEYILPESYETLKDITIAEPIISLLKTNVFPVSKFLIFGASKTKPDIIVKNVLDGDLSVLNDNSVLVYSDEIKESLTYGDFKAWWRKVAKKYSWYKPADQLNEMELKISNYYKEHYSADENPVLIPQVYLHYDPKDKKLRDFYHSNTLTFQRMDFLMLFNGHRIIIEIDGKEHFQDGEKYSRQCKYDREMKFLGYDVFRLGGNELLYDFENTVSSFFAALFDYIK